MGSAHVRPQSFLQGTARAHHQGALPDSDPMQGQASGPGHRPALEQGGGEPGAGFCGRVGGRWGWLRAAALGEFFHTCVRWYEGCTPPCSVELGVGFIR